MIFIFCVNNQNVVYSKDKNIKVNEIEFDWQEAVVIAVGDSYKMRARAGEIKGTLFYIANVKVKYESSNPQIATITQSGLLKAKKAGKCNIKASYGKLSCICQILVLTDDELVLTIASDNLSKNKFAIAVRTGNYQSLSQADKTRAKKYRSILSKIITDDMTDYEKVISIYIWILKNMEYEENPEDTESTPLYEIEARALNYGKADRVSYPFIFYNMLQSVGITSIFVLPHVHGAPPISVSAYIDGDWYISDIAKDDRYNLLISMNLEGIENVAPYFLQNNKEFIKYGSLVYVSSDERSYYYGENELDNFANLFDEKFKKIIDSEGNKRYPLVKRVSIDFPFHDGTKCRNLFVTFVTDIYNDVIDSDSLKEFNLLLNKLYEFESNEDFEAFDSTLQECYVKQNELFEECNQNIKKSILPYDYIYWNIMKQHLDLLFDYGMYK